MDTVDVKTTTSFKAWMTPGFAVPLFGSEDKVEEGPAIPLKDADPRVVDALAQTWINHLYAGLNRAPPVLFPEARDDPR